MFYLAAILIVAGVALFVAAPLGGGLIAAGDRAGRDEAARFEHDRVLAMQALADLEFDRAMGKLSDADYAAVRRDLEERALAAMEGIERLRTVSPPRPARIAPSPPPDERTRGKVRFCPDCGGSVGTAYRFCAQCGGPLGNLLDSSREAG